MLTRIQIETATSGELEALGGRIEAELTRRELEKIKKEKAGAPAGHSVVEEKLAPRGTYRLELVSCGKDRCKKVSGRAEPRPVLVSLFP